MEDLEFRDVEEWVKPENGSICLVECYGWTPCGYCVATFNQGKYETDLGDNITEYVTGYIPFA